MGREFAWEGAADARELCQSQRTSHLHLGVSGPCTSRALGPETSRWRSSPPPSGRDAPPRLDFQFHSKCNFQEKGRTCPASGVRWAQTLRLPNSGPSFRWRLPHSGELRLPGELSHTRLQPPSPAPGPETWPQELPPPGLRTQMPCGPRECAPGSHCRWAPPLATRAPRERQPLRGGGWGEKEGWNGRVGRGEGWGRRSTQAPSPLGVFAPTWLLAAPQYTRWPFSVSQTPRGLAGSHRCLRHSYALWRSALWLKRTFRAQTFARRASVHILLPLQPVRPSSRSPSSLRAPFPAPATGSDLPSSEAAELVTKKQTNRAFPVALALLWPLGAHRPLALGTDGPGRAVPPPQPPAPGRSRNGAGRAGAPRPGK